MKNILKLTLALTAVFLLSSTSSSYGQQKFAYIDSQQLINSMPERGAIEEKLKAYYNELVGMLESIQVELNNKYVEYQKGAGTYTDSVRQLKEKELQDLSTRQTEYQQNAEQDMQKMQAELFAPVIEKAKNAIETVARAQGVAGVFDLSSGALLYQDTSAMIDLLPLVKKELGIKD